MVIVIAIVPRADSGWALVVPLIIAGCGLGLLVSQLNNYTLSPISEEKVSQAAGVNSAAGSFGLSFGLAFAGAIMLATLSILFTDMVGSTQLYARRGDPGAFVEVKKHFDELFAIIRRHRGAVVKTIGDAAMGAFNAAGSLGFILGPLAGGLVSQLVGERFGWEAGYRAAFAVAGASAILCVAVALPVLLRLKRTGRTT